MKSILSLILSLLCAVNISALPKSVSLNGQPYHVQGIAWDDVSGRMYFTVTTKFIITDAEGTILGSVEGLHGHLGAMVFDSASRKVYASMECKDDAIGTGISRQLGMEGYHRSSFYIAEIDVDAVKSIDTPASDAVRLHELPQVAEDYSAEVVMEGKSFKHRYGCSGIDGVTIAPGFGGKGGSFLYVAYGIYSDTTRTDNDYQILFQYRMDRIGKPSGRYFIKTGNTTYGVQNLAYDRYSDKLFMVVYRGKKSIWPNYDIFSVDMSTEPERMYPEGIPYEKKRVMTIPVNDRCCWYFRWGKQGICPVGNGNWYITEDSVRKDDGDKALNDCTVRLYRWNGERNYSDGTPFVVE